MKTENKATYRFFKRELEELLKAGFSKEQAYLVLKRIHHAIDQWNGYHYAHIGVTAGQSLEYLIQQVQDEVKEQEQELKEHIRMRKLSYQRPEESQDIAELLQMEA